MENPLIASRRRPSASSSLTDWSQLPYDLVVFVANQLFDVVDFLSFSAVCHSWRLVYLNKNWTPNRRIPWLLLTEHYEGDLPVCQFLSFPRFKIYKLPLPEAHGFRRWGTSLGWVVTLDQDFAIRLVNPTTRACINLPEHSILRNQVLAEVDWFAAVQKAIVLTLRDEFVTMVIYGHNRQLAFARPGDVAWTTVRFSNPVSLINIVCFKDKILAVTVVGVLMLIDIEGPDSPRALAIASPPENEKGWQHIYLVESSENLLLIFRYNDWERFKFKIYKFDILGRKWIELVDLGNNLLLMDAYGCISVHAFGYFKPNCVYFVNDNTESILACRQEREIHTMIMYNIKHKMIEVYQIIENPTGRYNCPVWVTPVLW